MHKPIKINLYILSLFVLFFPNISIASTNSIPLSIYIHDTDKASDNFVTFGHVFPKRFLQSSETVELVLENKSYPVQMDVKAKHKDGSIRHAILTVLLPKGLETDETLKGTLRPIPLSSGLKSQSLDFQTQANVLINKGETFTLDTTLKTGNRSDISINLNDIIKKGQFSPYDPKPWLQGAYVTERRFSIPVAKGIQADLDLRLYANGQARGDIQFRYDSLQNTPMQGALSYGVALKQNGKPLFSQASVIQHPHTKWHDVFWWGKESPVYVSFDVANLINAGAIPPYDTSLNIASSAIENDYSHFEQSNRRLMGTGLMNPAMPTTGGRSDLGVLPDWTVKYLLSMDERMQSIVLTHGDLAGGIPWHYRDDNTGTAPTAENHPRIWLDDRATPAINGINPAVLDRNATAWIPDSAHQPSLSYIPYLITGDRYYLDSLQAQAQWNGLSTDPTYSRPSGEKTPSPSPLHQVREFAWNMRTFGEAAWITPDDDGLKEVFVKTLDRSLKWFEYMFVQGANNKHQTGEITGFLEGYAGDNLNPTFMQDFCGQAFSTLVQKDFIGWRSLVKWQTSFIAGRFLQRYNGFMPENATAHKFDQWVLNDPQGTRTLQEATKKYRKTWKEVYTATQNAGLFNMDRGADDTIPGYQHLSNGFAAYAKAALASLWNEGRDIRALEAYGFLIPHTINMNEKYATDPTFAIMPRFLNGQILSVANTQVGDSGNDTLKADKPNMLLHGGAGNDTLDGGQGQAFLFGGDGNDVLKAGQKDSVLMGGDGNDQLISGTGNDILASGTQPNTTTTFIYDGTSFGEDRIIGFRPMRDKILFITRYENGKIVTGPEYYYGITAGSYERLSYDFEPLDISSKIRTDGTGNAILDLKEKGKIIIEGVMPNQLGSENVKIQYIK